ncbi:adenylate/guanylate cyclase domain-containing protein [Spongisporangium articulatum]|uniref:Adenylate/guanylate cyclase domain-containing protein n=1 Tax=Spongisporangium articulatum TaxID=3362603 RepID=A0ABW8AJU4_9ACTN
MSDRGPVGAQLPLRPYVPRLVIDWLSGHPEQEYRRLDATLVFADISGFTALTERLSRRGKVGAEEMGDLLNATFEQLLGVAYAYGCMLLKWGGDAVLLSFTGPGHAGRAARAAQAMQRTIRTAGRLETSVGTVRLGMSIGVHSGPVDAFLAATPRRELLVLGPAATAVTTMEKYAERGEVLLSPGAVAALVAEGHPAPGAVSGPGFLLEATLDVDPSPAVTPADITGLDLTAALDPSLCDHLLGGVVAPEHRHIAVGFVEFSGVDAVLDAGGPDALLPQLQALLTRAQDVVAAQQITLLSTDVNADGGKIILISGAPRATGDDETRVLAAVQQIVAGSAGGVGDLRLRAGVNHGAVFAGDYGPAYRRVYSIAGDCVNLAARLMASAEPGEVRVMPSVLERSRTRYATTELPPFAAKGKAEPVRSLRLGRPLGEVESADERGPLIGRDRELGVLHDALRTAIAGTGRVIELVGDRGMGKSRLVAEFCSTAGVPVLRARGETYAGATPYTPWRRLLRARLGVGDDEAAIVERLRALAGEVEPWLPLIGIVAGVELPATPEVDALDAKFRKARLEQVMCRFLEQLVGEPALICLEDVHLMDAASHDLLKAVAATAAGQPWLVMGTRTTEGVGRLTEAGARELRLEPLSEAAALEFLTSSTTTAPIAPHRMAAILRRASGNPLYLREIVLAVLAGGDPDDLPTSVEALAAAHVDRLAPTDRQVLRTAAVLGNDVELALLHELLEPAAPEQVPDHSLDLSALHEFLRPARPGWLAFEHQVLREVAYEGLPYSRRTALHARAAEAITAASSDGGRSSSALLSMHYRAAGAFQKAWRTAMVAATEARAQYALADAVTLYRRGLAAAEHLPNLAVGYRIDAWEALGDVHYDLGDFAEADAAYRKAWRLLGSQPLRMAGLRLRIAKVHERAGELRRALGWLTRARADLDGLEGPEPDRLRARLAARYAWVRSIQGNTDQALEWARRAEEEALDSREDGALAIALRVLDVVDLHRGEIPERPRVLEAVRLLRALGERIEVGHALAQLGVLLYFRGNWTEAVERYTQARATFLEAGDQWNAATMSANLAEVLVDQGEDAAALDLLEPAMRIWQANGLLSEIAFGRTLLCRLAARAGDLATALEHATAAGDFYVESGEKAQAWLADVLRAEAHLLCGDPATALTVLGGLPGPGGDSDLWAALTERVRGEALARLGEPDGAREALLAGLESARSRKADHEVAYALAALLRHDLVPADDVETYRAECDLITGRLGIRHELSPATR